MAAQDKARGLRRGPWKCVDLTGRLVLLILGGVFGFGPRLRTVGRQFHYAVHLAVDLSSAFHDAARHLVIPPIGMFETVLKEGKALWITLLPLV